MVHVWAGEVVQYGHLGTVCRMAGDTCAAGCAGREGEKDWITRFSHCDFGTDFLDIACAWFLSAADIRGLMKAWRGGKR